MKRLLIALCTMAILAASVAIVVQPWQRVIAQDSRTIAVEVTKGVMSDSEDGGECFPWGFVDTTLEIRPFRQMIVTNQHGDIVGAVDLQVGELTTTASGDRSCTITSALTVDDASFYTFAVESKYQRTVSREALEDMNWELSAHLL